MNLVGMILQSPDFLFLGYMRLCGLTVVRLFCGSRSNLRITVKPHNRSTVSQSLSLLRQLLGSLQCYVYVRTDVVLAYKVVEMSLFQHLVHLWVHSRQYHVNALLL